MMAITNKHARDHMAARMAQARNAGAVDEARLIAARTVLEEADESVIDYEALYRRPANNEAEKRLYKAYLDLWKRIQRIAGNDVRKYGGAV
jgi:hypothetical protein